MTQTSRKFTESEIVIATHNKGKVPEIRELLGDRVKQVYISSDFGLAAPAETGTTFVENALIKAQFTAKATGKVALADDSGFCVDALDGAPGVYAADWAEKPDGTRDFTMAMHKVRDEITKKWGGKYPEGAHFVSCLAIAWPDGHAEVVEGTVYGKVTFPMRGTNGFGYDPIFIADDYPDVTYGEMDPVLKNNTNHRADAFKKLLKKCF